MAALGERMDVDAAKAKASAPDRIGSFMVSSRLMTDPQGFRRGRGSEKLFLLMRNIMLAGPFKFGKSFSQFDDNEALEFGKKDYADAGKHFEVNLPTNILKREFGAAVPKGALNLIIWTIDSQAERLFRSRAGLTIGSCAGAALV
jgi:hypothetical protein